MPWLGRCPRPLAVGMLVVLSAGCGGTHHDGGSDAGDGTLLTVTSVTWTGTTTEAATVTAQVVIDGAGARTVADVDPSALHWSITAAPVASTVDAVITARDAAGNAGSSEATIAIHR